ncbi:uncharacterized protein LOC135694988 [Rhopilema esculentum]|uniref:uncharacterized protein LOC135694988 n=1 Tax=Rhopilema esculentum TaxID=499914 RepID=UPI0031D218BF
MGKSSPTVQDKLNAVYQESGMAKNHVEWKKVKAGEILAKGFPSDISPSPACTFGIATLKQLLQEDVVFSFQEAAVNQEGFKITSSTIEIQPDEDICLQEGDPFEEMNMTANTECLEEGLYKIDCLLDKKMMNKKPHYLVKWTGYPEPTWEPFTNIDDQKKIQRQKE